VDPPRRWLAAGAVAAVQMIVVAGLDGATRAGYDSSRNWVSQLSLGPGGPLGVANLALCAVWLLAFGLALRHHLRPSRAGRWAARSVLVAGTAMLVVAAVPIDPGLDYPPGVPAVHTVTGYLHQAGALLLFVSGTAAAVLLGRCLSPRFPLAAPAGVAVAAVMVLAFVAASVLVTLDITGTVTGTPSGLLERVALGAGLCWIGGVGLLLSRAR
jgi:hypothetical protein